MNVRAAGPSYLEYVALLEAEFIALRGPERVECHRFHPGTPSCMDAGVQG